MSMGEPPSPSRLTPWWEYPRSAPMFPAMVEKPQGSSEKPVELIVGCGRCPSRLEVDTWLSELLEGGVIKGYTVESYDGATGELIWHIEPIPALARVVMNCKGLI